MDAFVDTASAWLTNERQRAEREREVGRAWLSLLVEGNPHGGEGADVPQPTWWRSPG
jgi:hypothetical protein